MSVFETREVDKLRSMSISIRVFPEQLRLLVDYPPRLAPVCRTLLVSLARMYMIYRTWPVKRKGDLTMASWPQYGIIGLGPEETDLNIVML